MLILAGVSLNAIIGDNGIITNAQKSTILSGIAEIEEYIQQYYVENFDNFGDSNKDNKIEDIIALKPNWFYHAYGFNIVDEDGYIHYLIDKNGFESDTGLTINGGTAGDGSYLNYYKLNDVYGVTAELKVYYCAGENNSGQELAERIYGISSTGFDKDNPDREIINTFSSLGSILKDFDKNSDGKLTLSELSTVTELTINKDSGVDSLNSLCYCISLKKLTLDGLTISSLNGIDTLGNLRYLYMKNIDSNDYNAIKYSKKLQYLYVERYGNTEQKDNLNVSKMLSAMKGIDYNDLEYLGIFGDSDILTNMRWEYNEKYGWKKSNVTDISGLKNLSNTTKGRIRYLYLERLSSN